MTSLDTTKINYQDREDILSVVDRDGNTTGETVGYFEAHSKGVWHQSAHIWIYNEKGEILLQKRGRHAVFPGMYDISAAGHIEEGDTPRQTAKKEMQEELGFTPLDTELVKVAVKKVQETDGSRNWVNNEFVHIFLLFINSDKEFKFAPNEVESVKWLSHDQFSYEITDELTKKKYVPHGEYYNFVMALVRERLELGVRV